MIGETVLTQKDLQSEILKTDTIGLGSFVIDCHIVQRIVAEDGTVCDEGSFKDVAVQPYQIAYRSLTPKRAECENLLVPVCLSASHIAYCSLRMEPQYMIAGHAAGVAAVLALESKVPVQAIDIATLQAKLTEQKAILELPEIAAAAKLPGIVVHDQAAELVGEWTVSSFGAAIGGMSRHDGDEGKGAKSARFTATVTKPGVYEVRFAYTPATNRARNVPITVEHAEGKAQITVDERQAPAGDKYFTSLGSFRFTPEKPAVVTITTEGTDGYVAIDALQLLGPKEN